MNEADCIQFLQWALPQLHLRWQGFRKVHRRVCRRVRRRLVELQLATFNDYRTFLGHHPSEWSVLDSLCWISISRFYRDRVLFQRLEADILPHLAEQAIATGRSHLTCWSLGSASGEEPYTLAIIWNLGVAPRLMTAMTLDILATDIDAQAIERAGRACYEASSTKDLPVSWLEQAFVSTESGHCLKPEHRSRVTFQEQDVRQTMPDGPFDLILCRYVVFTYFDGELQQALLTRMMERLQPEGALVIGTTDAIPTGQPQLEPWPGCNMVYRKH
jgi:chemotaxis protein methyltransferase CheR